MGVSKRKPLGLLERWSFGFMNSIVRRARTGDLKPADLFLPEENHSSSAFDDFQKNWEEETSQGAQPSLVRALRRTYQKPFMVAGIFKAFWSICVITGAFFFVRSLLDHVNRKAGSPYNTTTAGWALVAGFFLDAWLLGMSLQRMAFGALQCGIKARSALVNAVCRKSFNMSSMSQSMAADVVSFVATDINKVFEGMQEFHYLWTAPFEAAAILILLGTLVGKAMLPGLGVILLVVPLQYYFGLKIVSFKMGNAKNIQQRSGILTEVLPAIKLVKYYAWEQFFIEEVDKVREQELRINWWNKLVKVVNVAMVFCVPPLTAFVIFTSYEFQESRLQSTVAFTTLSLFNILRFPLVVLPKALRAVSDAYAALQRLQAFLLAPAPQGSHTPATRAITASKGAAGVRFTNAVLHHPSNPAWKLQVPELRVQPGEVVAVVGLVGAGKSSLIHAILGNMVLDSGNLETSGAVGYVPQNPWTQNLSLRDNVVFGEAFDAARYDQVIHNCALTLDLDILAHGDQTKAGLRGINFSGGQRQRVNLARCAYGPGQLMLLDNALSAVDHHTASHIFDHLIKDQFRDKATLLITHQLEFLPRCDNVAIMEEGRCVYFGPWNTSCATILQRLHLATEDTLLMAQHTTKDVAAVATPLTTSATESLKPNKSGGLSLSQTTLRPMTTSQITEGEDDEAAEQGGNKKRANKRAGKKQRRGGHAARIGPWRAAGLYVKYGGVLLFAVAVLCFLAAQTSRQLSDFWVRWWTNDKYKQYNGNPNDQAAKRFYALVYMSLGVAAFWTFMMLRGYTFLTHVLGSAEAMRKRMLHNVLHAPMGFFLATPIGELLLNFSRDQEILDENLPDAMHFVGIYGLILAATTITVSITMVYFAPFVGGLIAFTAIMLMFYLPASTQLKKMRTESGGQLVSLVAEALEGLPLMHAARKQQYFVSEVSRRLDDFHAALFNAESLNLWLAFYCDFIGACLVLACSSFAVALAEQLGAATVGLAFSNTIQMLVFYTWVVRFIAECVSLWASVEQVSWLATYVPQDGAGVIDEHGGVSKGCPVPGHAKEEDEDEVKVVVSLGEGGSMDKLLLKEHNPDYGRIVFENVWMQYRARAPFALKAVSFTIDRAEKVGVVGRTGSGKSTLLLALFRMFELGRGRICVNGCDITALPLKALRASLSIIPQEPVMFSGTVRSNLDPFNEHADNELWAVLRKAGLDGQVRENPDGLYARVDGTGGKAWSLGQQQLVCLCRAALRPSPILCLDEATAAMDPHTERQVQATIKQVFADRTTLTIAHRLDTVIEADKVIVMEQGVLKEMAHPHTLLSDRDTLFSKLVDKSPAPVAEGLRRTAHAHYVSSGAEARASRKGSTYSPAGLLGGMGFGTAGLQMNY